MKLESTQENICFQGEDLKDITVSGTEFTDCIFEYCTIDGAAIINCSFTDCTFIHCHISNLTVKHSSVNNLEFVSCCLSGIRWKEWSLSGSYIRPIRKMEDSQLKYNIFEEINFNKFDFSGNAMIASMFAGCQLSGSQFQNCQLDRTEFFRCDLKKADFRHATGYAIDLSTNEIKGAKFSFPEVVNLLGSLDIVIE